MVEGEEIQRILDEAQLKGLQHGKLVGYQRAVGLNINRAKLPLQVVVILHVIFSSTIVGLFPPITCSLSKGLTPGCFTIKSIEPTLFLLDIEMFVNIWGKLCIVARGTCFVR